jgi:hypothetical protein
LLLAISFVPFGIPGQKIGLRAILTLIGLAGCTAGPIFYYLLLKFGYQFPMKLMVLVTLINLLGLKELGMPYAYTEIVIFALGGLLVLAGGSVRFRNSTR